MLVDGGHVTFAGGCDWRIPWVCRCKWPRVCLFGCPQQQRLRGSAATQRPLWARGLRGRGNTKNGTKAPAAKKKTHNQILPPGPPTLLGPPWGFAWQQRDGQVWGLGSHMGKKSPTLGVEGNVFVAMCLWQRNRFWCMGKWWVESTLPGF